MTRSDAQHIEVSRLAALHSYGILDTPPDGAFDRLAALAAELFDVPIAIVSLVDHDRIWFKAAHGLDVKQIDRSPGLCASAILQDAPYVLADAAKDARSLSNPLVAGEFGLRFYAAVPLRTEQGHNLGTICVIDREPREISQEQVAKLEVLAALVMDQMNLRLEARKLHQELTDQAQRLHNDSTALEVLNRTGTQVAAELDVGKVVQQVVDAGVEISGARFGAFFYSVESEAGERMMLYSLSGAKISDFERFGMPRPTAIFAPTFNNEGVVRSDDILNDPRYGLNKPNVGMPEGHLPVRSYLATSVVSRSGEVIGGLFFGHPEPGVFDARAERLMSGLAAQAAVAIDNARLFTLSQRTNAELEQRVEERTRELEIANEALRQSQKMEAIGQLTGGIAHDFNNMLAVIVGSLDLLGRRLGTGDARSKRYLDAAAEGATRATTLTQRLLAFARQQPLAPEVVNANTLVANMSELLRHSLGADIRLETVLSAGLWRLNADPNQLENVIINLAVNARDAMPGGGRLTIETQNCFLDEKYVASHLGLSPGQYVMMAVTDTGSGMSKSTIDKAFDPFFTTKGVGKGTGLGLSQVYGFVKQSGGHVKIYSELDEGTSIKIYFPRHLGTEEPGHVKEEAPEDMMGEPQEVILVVEDEPSVRQFSVDALCELGYKVIEADSAAAALRLIDSRPDISLLFTDVVMPDVNGRQLADQALLKRPDLKVLFTTGYSRNAVVHNGVLDAGVELIGKPFTLNQLAAKVRSVLEG